MHQNAFHFRQSGMEKMRPPQDLRQKIILGITRQENSRAKIYFVMAATALPVSLAAVFLSGLYMVNSFNESGFYSYFSLLFMGDKAVLAYWKELAYTLIETMPVVDAIAFFIAIGLLIWSAANTLPNMRRFVLANH